MQASDIMTTPVVSIAPDRSVYDAAKLLTEHHISGMPVVDDNGDVIGVVSEGDLLRRVETGTETQRRSWLAEFMAPTRELAAEYLKEHSIQVRDVMSAPALTVHHAAPLTEVAELLGRKHIKRLPVLRDGKLVGIVSRANLVRALASCAPAQLDAQPSDEQIRRAIAKDLDGHRWAMASDGLIVTEGVVHCWGVARSEEERKAILAAAARVPGVKGVKDHMEYPGFFSSM
ncbi:CBS domain-containing protein [Paraburkholderia sp. UYCP14C]|uniref:CBS domain-containing protein n=1 Tax=Paraburkholderia sp. UYCP14C TaxID=2511130 RepID=UPI0010211CCB|nr:CBS domain-containing protein [Paraburkholderia sp. UYCP14C]RZF24522.1 CBS domain-containing protein [Paraburkholderia sp. UYCP14C]